MAQAVQTRCRGCGEYLTPRPGLDDWAAEERAYHQDRYQEHDCPAEYSGYSLAPRPGERDAWLATLDGDELVAELGQAGAAAYVAAWAGEAADIEPAGPVAPVAEPPTVEMVDLGELTRRANVAARAMADQVVAEAVAVTRTVPAGPSGPGHQTTLGGIHDGRPRRQDAPSPGQPARGGRRPTGPSARPERQRDPGRVRPAPYLDAPAGWWDPARPGPAADLAPIPLARVGRDRHPAAAGPRRRGLRLSRALRWFQADDPRLARVLERPARAAERLERIYLGS